MLLSDLDFKIPDDLIATRPAKPRDESKLVIVENNFKTIKFKKIINIIRPNDAIVFNDTKVLHSFLNGFIKTRKVSINLNKLFDQKKEIWSVFIKSNKKPKINDKIIFDNELFALIIDEIFDKNYQFFLIKFNLKSNDLKKKLNNFGKIPLPPYINKKRTIDENDFQDYQTVFAEKDGAVASPTASLHFTKKLIKDLKIKKVNFINITLHVNGGTFLPIKTQNIEDHKMHSELGEISEDSAKRINKVRENGGRIIAVGTTVLRILESSKNSNGQILPFKGETNIFLKPGCLINTVDGIITNFHTPKSSLLLLVFALLGKEKTLNLYNYAIKNRLRFFSYGDACLIWNKNGKI
ncbi:MAG: tRNA preQ1(34) S-adenosylmethionine ribosyltransferase-isomerase QueA [Rickettsiales bacterium]|nr:tRNA preQ1(34) S-adenosylmethionine ribosyltransferase-isomerase QueA [Rickettsiales bacterium]RPG15322.1 MAG: tRNA preQ1(34) S-adenosylmethionine ribosyltransferase-isomerase QueA [Pelagibacteraceae bacterium TMED195]|tara:strand:- start:2360 stop:3415 length:1056 start_codon:yes stop_codon:yes gene_type:complete